MDRSRADAKCAGFLPGEDAPGMGQLVRGVDRHVLTEDADYRLLCCITCGHFEQRAVCDCWDHNRPRYRYGILPEVVCLELCCCACDQVDSSQCSRSNLSRSEYLDCVLFEETGTKTTICDPRTNVRLPNRNGMLVTLTCTWCKHRSAHCGYMTMLLDRAVEVGLFWHYDIPT